MEFVKVERQDRWATVTIDRPRAMNALNAQVLEELAETFAALSADEHILVAILTGGGEKAFVAGADIGSMVEMDIAQARAFADLGHRTFLDIEKAPLVVIAAINGFALGGGCELALACDMRIAVEKARLGQPEVNLGVMPGFGGTQRLPRVVGRSQAKRLIFTGDVISASRALQLGLVDQVVEADELLPTCQKLGQLIAQKGPLAVRSAKRAIDRGLDLSLDQGCAFEAEEFAQLFATEDQKEGMQAFLGKREPAFRGK